MPSETESSIFQSSLPLEAKLERARMELLDLGARNRLLNVPRFSKSAKTIDVVDEISSEVARLLVRESKTFTFAPGRPDRPGSEPPQGTEGPEAEEEDASPGSLSQPDEPEEVDERGVLRRHADTKLQTRMTPAGLQKRLLDLYYDARTLEDEQGVNVLFLALGLLKWIDPNNKQNVRYAPLILVPVKLERGTAGEKFRLRARPEEQSSNLSLETYLERVHTLKLPPFDASEDFDPTSYLAGVAEAISTKQDWEVLPNEIILGFFSFAKFLMYRDLDPELWPADGKLTDHPLIRPLVSDGFDGGEALLSEDLPIDPHIAPADMLHILDSDSSQTLAVHDVRQGRDLVIQGPPGTGKSQTIANIIASAVADGKTVLFVAEKMAALDVVKRRLDQAGVGDACLELHSNKANKKGVLDELRRTWELGSPRGEVSSSLPTQLREARDALNAHAVRMHTPHLPSSLTPYQVIGALVRLRREGQRPVDLRLYGATSWTADDLVFRRRLLKELSQRIDDIGLPASHPWAGVGLRMILPTTLERLVPRVEGLLAGTEWLHAEMATLAGLLETAAATAFSDAEGFHAIGAILKSAPALEPAALGHPLWDDGIPAIKDVIAAGYAFRRMASDLSAHLSDHALNTDIDGLAGELAWLPPDFPPVAFERARKLVDLLPLLIADAQRLNAELGLEPSAETITSIRRIVATAERVAAAPDASPEAFVAPVWDKGVERAIELADAVATLEEIRARTANRLLDVAWTTDVAAARQALATNTGMLKALNGDWRKAKALVGSIVRDPNQPLPQLVELLDALMKGQQAAARIKDEDAFGQAAFGTDWRGVRSPSPPLLALAAWMRTLRGLGAEPRLIAGRLADRNEVGARAKQVAARLDQVSPLLTALWSDLGTSASAALDNAASSEHASLETVGWRAKTLIWTDDLCRLAFRAVPAFPPERLDLANRLAAWQTLATTIERHEETARTAFGSLWCGLATDWDRLSASSFWIEAHGNLRHLAARLQGHTDIAARTDRLVVEARRLTAELEDLLRSLDTDAERLFGSPAARDVSMSHASERFASWLAHTEQLSKWVAYRDRADTAREMGLAHLVDQLADGRLVTGAAMAAFEMAYHEALLEDLIATDPEIGRFDGNLHTRKVRDFADLDHKRIKAASLEVVRAHHRRIPAKDSGVGPIGVLRAEMARRRNHMPIRQLMQKAAPAIQALKPVLMMSPLSVAQFLPPGRLTFDLLVMDEASQIQPVDALGAIGRCRQVVVVGDERQLPPTKFFAKMIESQPEDEESDGAQVADIESILGLFTARGLPSRMLRWHYRSRHQSLIAVSNSQFYENKLFIVPSPYTQEAGMGLLFHHIADGTFDSGGSGTNAIEARAVAEAILRHAKASPALSLGVVTFSVSQRRAIQDQLELLRRLNPDTEDFFHAHPSEPFFVKNLENVQGDERDVIMISVGYARNPQGVMAMRFGPLGSEGGERRLNVLISRAKRRCEVFASITDEDIDLERARGKGVVAFKLFLQYARTGRLSLARASGREMDSIFEEQVAAALQERGYQVHPQVGIAGFFIDLAVADAERPGRYLIGIECDGASYHSARSARDRDRLRQAVLEEHGWIIHRIWSTDWFQRPGEQLERTIAAIDAAKAELEARLERGSQLSRAVPIEIFTIDRGDVTEVGLADAGETEPERTAYAEASVARPGTYDLHETPIGIMADLIEQVVRTEGPVHMDEVVTRIRSAWGLQRAGGRIQAAIEEAATLALNRGRIARDGDFLSLPDTTPLLRDRSNVSSQGLRKAEMIPPNEIAAGIVEVIAASFGATEDEIALTISRRLGFRATSATLRGTVAGVVEQLVQAGALRREDKMIVLPLAPGVPLEPAEATMPKDELERLH